MENKISLNEIEINLLKDFIKRAKNNKLVECIYIVAFDKNIQVCSIINSAIKNTVLNYKEELKKYKEEMLLLKKNIIEFHRNTNDEMHNYEFVLDYSNDYNVDLENTIQVLNTKKLISGYIVYDKYNYYDEIKEILLDKVTPYDNVFEIENIIELNDIYIKRK